jgi:hemerythrin
MNLIEWTEDLSVKNGVIDGQHKQLIAKMNEFIGLVDKGKGEDKILEIIDFLFEHLNQHIDYEEKYMLKYEFPGLEEHKIEHQKMLNITKKISERFDEVGVSHEFALEIKKNLFDWFVSHLKTYDLQYADFIREFPN